MNRGKLISLEGIDGVGKTTCATLLCKKLSLKTACTYVNRKAIPTTNNYIKRHMEYLYAIMWGKGDVFSKAPNIEYNGLNRRHWLYLMLSWYSAFEQHMILPKLERGISIITDGYIYKEIVKAIYSSGNFETEKEFDFLKKPDVVFYLSASPKECVRADSNTNRIESGAFVKKYSDFVTHQSEMKLIYDRLAKEKEWITIIRDKDAEKTCENIAKLYYKHFSNEEH